MAITLSYSEFSKGWVSFHSYEPEWMERLGSTFFSFKNGNLYKHDANATRMNFYDSQYSMSVTYSANKAPSDVKVFKTVKLESNSRNWYADLVTEMETGEVGSSGSLKFVEKERMQYGYIRRKANDKLNFNELSILGIGNLVSSSGDSYTFSYNIPNQVSANNADGIGGDQLYFVSGGVVTLIGDIDSINGSVITLVSSAVTPQAGDYCFVAKDPQSESYGLRGYYAQVKLINTSTDFVELFASNSEVFKSYM